MSDVYTSEQYRMLIDLSGLMSSLVYNIPFSSAVANELSTKLNISDELLIIPSSFYTTTNTHQYNKDVMSAGINIVTTSEFRPSIYFKYVNNNKLTFDQVSTELDKSNRIDNVSGYASHYVSGNLNRIYLDILDDPIGVNSVARAFNDHNLLPSAHVNLDSLINYYDKINIDTKEEALNTKLITSAQVLLSKIQDTYNELTHLLNVHKENSAAHKNVDQLAYYYLKTEVDKFVEDSKIRLVNHNSNNAAHPYILNEISKDKQDLVSFKNLYRDEHTNQQIKIHNYLLEKLTPETYGPTITINSDRQAAEWQGLIVYGKNNNSKCQYVFNSTSKPELNIGLYVPNGSGYITAKLLNESTKVVHNITLLDPNGHTYLNKAHLGVTPPDEDSSDLIPDTAWVKKFVLDNSGNTPIGTIVWWHGNVNQIPVGWLLCDGREIPSAYTKLRQLIGSYTPNLIDRFVKGSKTAGIYQDPALPNIVGSFAADNSQIGTSIEGSSYGPTGSFYGVRTGHYDMSSSR